MDGIKISSRSGKSHLCAGNEVHRHPDHAGRPGVIAARQHHHPSTPHRNLRAAGPVRSHRRTYLLCFLMIPSSDGDDSPIEVLQAGMTSHKPTSHYRWNLRFTQTPLWSLSLGIASLLSKFHSSAVHIAVFTKESDIAMWSIHSAF